MTDCGCCAFECAYYNRLTFVFCLSGVTTAPKLGPRRVIPTPSRIWVCIISLFLGAAAPTMHPLKDAFHFAVLDISSLRSAINTCHVRMPFCVFALLNTFVRTDCNVLSQHILPFHIGTFHILYEQWRTLYIPPSFYLLAQLPFKQSSPSHNRPFC